jgi:hypothetical protein
VPREFNPRALFSADYPTSRNSRNYRLAYLLGSRVTLLSRRQFGPAQEAAICIAIVAREIGLADPLSIDRGQLEARRLVSNALRSGAFVIQALQLFVNQHWSFPSAGTVAGAAVNTNT